MRGALAEIVPYLLLGLGVISLTSPFLLWWRVHRSYERHVWIISGPYPYDNLGGGPFQLMVYSRLLATGFVPTCVALMLRAFERDPD